MAAFVAQNPRPRGGSITTCSAARSSRLQSIIGLSRSQVTRSGPLSPLNSGVRAATRQKPGLGGRVARSGDRRRTVTRIAARRRIGLRAKVSILIVFEGSGRAREAGAEPCTRRRARLGVHLHRGDDRRALTAGAPRGRARTLDSAGAAVVGVALQIHALPIAHGGVIRRTGTDPPGAARIARHVARTAVVAVGAQVHASGVADALAGDRAGAHPARARGALRARRTAASAVERVCLHVDTPSAAHRLFVGAPARAIRGTIAGAA